MNFISIVRLLISAKIVLDSVNEFQDRLTTIEFVAPRCILAQFNTHRVFSRNAASSRAIPVSKILTKVIETPFIPIWNLNKPGMQGNPNVPAEKIELFDRIWLEARDSAVRHAEELAKAGAHKQSVNRLLEPFSYFKGLVSSTKWDNFISLREDDAAQPEIATLATAIREALEGSTPNLVKRGWHLPYVLSYELELYDTATLLKISVARCARVSYKTFDEDKLSTSEKDILLANQLLTDRHFSPFEHQAYATSNPSEHNFGNFSGWEQYRKYLENSQ
jgi:thymidylate synthase ThyX